MDLQVRIYTYQLMSHGRTVSKLSVAMLSVALLMDTIDCGIACKAIASISGFWLALLNGLLSLRFSVPHLGMYNRIQLRFQPDHGMPLSPFSFLCPIPTPSLMVSLTMTLAVVFILQKHVLVATVCSKSHGGNAQAREGRLEPIPPAEEACVSPFLAVNPNSLVSQLVKTLLSGLESATDYRSHGS